MLRPGRPSGCTSIMTALVMLTTKPIKLGIAIYHMLYRLGDNAAIKTLGVCSSGASKIGACRWHGGAQ